MRKSPLKLKSRTPSAKLKAECDRLWSMLVRQRNPVCEWCNQPSQDAHHMVGRGASAFLRHRLENGVALCKGCHFKFHNGESYSGWDRFKESRPEDFEFVMAHKSGINRVDYAEVLARLKEINDEREGSC